MRLVIAAAGLSLLAGTLQGCVPLVVGGAAAGVAVAHDRRSAASQMQDTVIETTFFEQLAKDKEFGEDSHINITSYNQIVLLSGEVPTRELGLKAAQIARGIENVRQVHNELAIAAPTSLAQRSNDTLITTAAKSALLKVDLKGFDPTRVKVVTEAGVVYLFGLLTPDEADMAVEQVRRVGGVQKVVRLFELIQ